MYREAEVDGIALSLCLSVERCFARRLGRLPTFDASGAGQLATTLRSIADRLLAPRVAK